MTWTKLALQLSTGLSNWKVGLAKIRNHSRSEHHKEVNEVLFVLPKHIKDIGEQLDIGHASQKPGNRKALLIILENIRFLGRQGLPLQGDENNSNYKQLFLLRSEGDVFQEWLSRRNNTYLSKDIQNEILRLMAEISSNIKQSAFYSLMANEATDIGNRA